MSKSNYYNHYCVSINFHKWEQKTEQGTVSLFTPKLYGDLFISARPNIAVFIKNILVVQTDSYIWMNSAAMIMKVE